MTRGRKPRPRTEAALLGFPGKNRGEHQSEALPEKDSNLRMLMPARLKRIKGAARVWKESLASLPVKLQLHQVPAFSDLCICVARLQECERLIEEQGLLVEGQKKNGVKNPLLQIAREYRAAVQRWAGEFYLTAAASERIPKERPGPRPGGILNGEFRP